MDCGSSEHLLYLNNTFNVFNVLVWKSLQCHGDTASTGNACVSANRPSSAALISLNLVHYNGKTQGADLRYGASR